MLLRQTLLYLPAQLVGPLALFVAAVVWTHLMPPDPYGTLMLIMATQEFIFAFGLAWLSLTVLRYRDALERGEGAERFRRAEAGLLYGSIIAQILAAAIVLPLIGRPEPALIAAAALFIVTRSVLTHLAERMRAGGDVAGYTIAQTAGPVAGFILALALARVWGATPAIALLGYGVAQLVALPIAWRRSGAALAPAAPTKHLLDPLLRYGLPLLLSGVATWFCINGIRVVVDMAHGATALGLMSVGWGLGQRIASTVAMLVTAAAFPLAVKAFNAGDHDGAMNQLAQNGALLIALLAPATVGLVLVDDELVKLLIGADYWTTTIAILPLAVLSGALRCVRMHYGDQVFLLHERTGWLLVITFVEAAMTMAFATVGATSYGIVGAVMGVVIAHGLVMFWVMIQGVVMLGLRVRWPDLARIAAATAIMAGAVWLMPAGASALRLGLVVAVGAAVYAAALAAFFPEMIGKLRRAGGV